MAEYPSSLPWLKPPDPAEHLLAGFRAGSQIAEANARLAESARTADIGFSLDQQRLQEQSRKEQQQVEVQRAYHQQTTALKTQQLQQAKEVNDAHISQVAQQAGQRQEIQKRAANIHAAVDAGTLTKEEGDNQITRLAVETSMGTPQGPAALRAAQAAEPAQAPQITKSPQGQELFYGKPGTFKLGTSTGTGSDKAATAMDMADYRSTLSQLAAIRRAETAKTISPEDAKAQTTDLQRTADAIRKRRLAGTATGTTPDAAAPKGKRVKVVGPKGQKGTIIEGDSLPDGWKLAGEEKPTASP